MDIWTNVWCVWLARSRCMCLAFWFLGPVFMIDNGFRLHTCHGPCHLGLLLLTSKNERDCNVTGALRAIWNDEQRQKKKKRKGIRSLASNLWIVCDSSHDEAFDLEYSNVVANSPCWALSKRARVDQAGSERSQQLALATCYHGPSPSTISL